MSKRDAYSDAEEEEELDILPSEDEDAKDSRFSNLRSKRRKLQHSFEEPSDSDASDLEAFAADGGDETDQGDALDDEAVQDESSQSRTSKTKPTTLTPKSLTPSQLAKSHLRARKSGVIYLSRIPPFMKVHTLKSYFSPYGTLGRVFLTPEAPARYQARVKAGGNKKRSFVDGWIEFESKKKAKICAETLNGNIVGGKKGGWYHDDIWNVKYLKGFKWNDLMEQVQGEERERVGRLRAEIGKETRERKAFLENVERARVERGMEGKRAEKSGKGEGVVGSEVSGPASKGVGKRPKMKFRQNAVKAKGGSEQGITAATLTSLF